MNGNDKIKAFAVLINYFRRTIDMLDGSLGAIRVMFNTSIRPNYLHSLHGSVDDCELVYSTVSTQ